MSKMFFDNDDLRLHQALNVLLRADGYLLANNLSERSITHKLAEHLQNLFFEWNVDCEFNRNLDLPKEILINPEEILKQMADKLEESHYLQGLELNKGEIDPQKFRDQMMDLERQLRDRKRISYLEELDIVVFLLSLDNKQEIKVRIYPDIIIHHRGTPNNHIVVEAKKSLNKNNKARGFDLVKLMTLTSSADFRYKRGYFIDLPVQMDFARSEGFLNSQLIYDKVYRIDPDFNP